jgi:hypothetical protein
MEDHQDIDLHHDAEENREEILRYFLGIYIG